MGAVVVVTVAPIGAFGTFAHALDLGSGFGLNRRENESGCSRYGNSKDLFHVQGRVG